MRQIRLVVLDETYFPEDIVNKFHELKDDQLARPRIQYGNVNMRDLLEGTRYITQKKQSSEASIFKQIDRLHNPLF